VSPLARLRLKKKKLVLHRDAALGVAGRLEAAEQSHAAAKTIFFAGMSARGFTRTRALRLWREQAPRAR
jgi:hypothetical protein